MSGKFQKAYTSGNTVQSYEKPTVKASLSAKLRKAYLRYRGLESYEKPTYGIAVWKITKSLLKVSLSE